MSSAYSFFHLLIENSFHFQLLETTELINVTSVSLTNQTQEGWDNINTVNNGGETLKLILFITVAQVFRIISEVLSVPMSRAAANARSRPQKTISGTWLFPHKLMAFFFLLLTLHSSHTCAIWPDLSYSAMCFVFCFFFLKPDKVSVINWTVNTLIQ